MKNTAPVLKAVKAICITLLSIGAFLFAAGVFGSESGSLIAVGIGTIAGAVFIFLMGVFFVATEEMLAKTGKG